MKKTGIWLGCGALLLSMPAGRGEEAVDLLEGKAVELKVEVPAFPAAQAAAQKEQEEMDAEKLGADLLPAAVRQDFAEFTSKVAAQRRLQLQPDMEKTAQELQEKAKLDEAGSTRLKALATAAVDESMKAWEAQFGLRYAPFLVQSGDPGAVLKAWKPEQFVGNSANLVAISPTHTAVWKEGLKAILTPEYHAAMEVEAAEQRKQVLAEMEGYLADAEFKAGELFSSIMDHEVEQILQHRELDETRQNALRGAAEEARKVTLQNWRKRAENRLAEMDEKSLKIFSRNRGEPAVDPAEPGNRPQERGVWKTARRTILTEPEQQAIWEGQQGVKDRRAGALAMTIISQMDTMIGLSGSQREKLLELGRPLMLSLPKPFFEAPAVESYTSLDAGQILTEIREIPESTLAALLDPAQLRRWQAMTPADLPENNRYSVRNAAAVPGKPAEVMDENEAGRLIALTVSSEVGRIQQRAFSRMEARVDDIARVVSLSPETVALLRTAGKGAAMQTTKDTVNNLDQYVVQQMKGVKPGDIPARLKALSMPRFQESRKQVQPRIWTAALQRLLTAPQLELWKQEGKAREDWQQRATSALVVTEVEKYLVLPSEKRELLLQKVDAVINTYEAEISNFFSPGWQFQSYYNTIPLALLAEKEMAEVFNPKQLETVRTRSLGRVTQYADMIRQQHGQRPDQ
jgi:hypothetical protein